MDVTQSTDVTTSYKENNGKMPGTKVRKQNKNNTGNNLDNILMEKIYIYQYSTGTRTVFVNLDTIRCLEYQMNYFPELSGGEDQLKNYDVNVEVTKQIPMIRRGIFFNTLLPIDFVSAKELYEKLINHAT